MKTVKSWGFVFLGIVTAVGGLIAVASAIVIAVLAVVALFAAIIIGVGGGLGWCIMIVMGVLHGTTPGIPAIGFILSWVIGSVIVLFGALRVRAIRVKG